MLVREGGIVSQSRSTNLAIAAILLMPVVGLGVAFIVARQLPSESRDSFWLTGVLCMFLTVVIWGLTCGPALTR